MVPNQASLENKKGPEKWLLKRNCPWYLILAFKCTLDKIWREFPLAPTQVRHRKPQYLLSAPASICPENDGWLAFCYFITATFDSPSFTCSIPPFLFLPPFRLCFICLICWPLLSVFHFFLWLFLYFLWLHFSSFLLPFLLSQLE